MYTGGQFKNNAAQQIGKLIVILGVIGFFVVLILMESELSFIYAFGVLISNIALGTILVTLGNIQELLELDTIEIEDED